MLHELKFCNLCILPKSFKKIVRPESKAKNCEKSYRPESKAKNCKNTINPITEQITQKLLNL